MIRSNSCSCKTRPRGNKTSFMPKSAEYEMVGILTFISRKNSIIGLSEPKKLNFLIFLGAFKISCSAELSMEKVL